MKVILLAATVLAFHVSAQAAETGKTTKQTPAMVVKALNQQLEKAHAGWVAKETPLTGISKADAKHMLGLNREPALGVSFVKHAVSSRADLPAVLDWRNKDGVNWVSPILNQANCGSCVAFAAIGVMETMVNISSMLPNSHVRLSPQNLFACGGGSCGFGWQPEGAATFLQATGVPDESCQPYTSGATGEDVTCDQACSDSAKRVVKIADYKTPSRSMTDTDGVKAALQHGPLVTTLSVYADFVSYSGGVYKHVTGDELGGHAISIVGYDDTKQAFIVRNSWGPDWGDNGFGYVAYDDTSGVGDETWLYEMPTITGAVSLATPIDYNYLTGQMPVSATSTYPGTASMSIAILKDGTEAATATCGTPCSHTFDVSALADGRYDVQVTAMDASGKTLGTSARHMTYIANAQPTLSLTFTGKDVDLTQDLKDRVEFNVAATSSSVPMSSLVFHYKGPDGVDHTKTANIVMSAMTLGWRTNLGPNGKYEIWMVGHLTTNAFDKVVESAHVMVNTSN